MAMKQCPICGEKYSETYKTVPSVRKKLPFRREAISAGAFGGASGPPAAGSSV